MSRLIDADTLLEKVEKIQPWDAYLGKYAQGIRHCMELVSLLIQNAPTIEPERETGKWIVVHPTKESTEYVACDQCGQVEAWDENVGMLCALVGERYAHFCPNCGARMSGGEQPCN